MRKVKIMDTKYISVFKMDGPVFNPIAVSESDILKLIIEGHVVYETNANGITIQLTRANYNNPARFGTVTNTDIKTTPVYGEASDTDTKADTFTGYTSKTAPEMPPVPSTNQNLSKNQLKKLRKEQEAAARAAKTNAVPVEIITQETKEVPETTEEAVEE